MEEHKKYLADRLLSEERPVSIYMRRTRFPSSAAGAYSRQITYRLVSRALNVHVNTAKE